jgi:hypothetical protein
MGKTNYGRLILGAVVAGVIYFVCDGTIHGALLGQYHMAAVTRMTPNPTADNTSYIYFALFDLGKGLVAMLIYLAARARCGPGPKTAVWAGLVAWLAVEVLPSIEWMPFPFYEKSFFVKVMALELLPMVLGAVIGAWLYKDAEG